MPDLIAQGLERRHRWRRRLPGDATVVNVGRVAGVWSVGWDTCISRQHLRLRLSNTRLHVEKLPDAANHLFFQGRVDDNFWLSIGEHFVVGDTRFTLVDHSAEISLDVQQPADRRTFSGEYLRRVGFQHAQTQIQALSRLPEIVTSAQTDGELYPQVIQLLLSGLADVQAAAIVRCHPRDTDDDDRGAMSVLHWDRIGTAVEDFQPSGRLIREAVERSQNVVHVWRSHGSDDPLANRPSDGGRQTDVNTVSPNKDQRDTPRTLSRYTAQNEFDWAFCVPIPGTECQGDAIYAAGCGSQPLSEDTLQDGLKFVELVGTTVGSVCDVRRLQKQTTALSHFFSRPVRDAVAAGDPEIVLAPRETEVSVLFCDLRGFSRQSEQDANDLFGLLQRVSEALGIMTHEILEHGGVIGDFHGDAAMGFWGWPLATSNQTALACATALRIQQAFNDAAQQNATALSGFRVGMGLATGPAVAGKIGTVDQVKVTAFGPVVNLASRLEGMTRQFGLPILIDEATAARARHNYTDETPTVRPIGQVRPYGMQTAHRLFTLEPTNERSIDDQASFDAGLTAFESGDWQTASRCLRAIAASDVAARFLLNWIDQRNSVAPNGWNGVIELDRK